MRSINLKYYICITSIIFIDSLHNIFFNNDLKLDIYLFYNHPRYIDNILFDISRLYSFSVLSFLLIRLNKRIFKPLFIMSLGVWVSYFTFYNQISSLFIIPLYICAVIYYDKKRFKNGKYVKS